VNHPTTSQHAVFSLVVAAGLACAPPSHDRPEGVMVVVQEQQSAWLRNFNPFLPVGSSRWPSAAGVHEPLLIYSPMTGDYTPWLAESFRWDVPAEQLTFRLRPDVLWSDGTPLTAQDVAFTFSLIQAHKALDQGGVWKLLAAVDAPDTHTVTFRFKQPFSPGLLEVGHTPIVPEHVWSKVEDPVTFTNPDPVASGPFTEVVRFESQVFELGRNPHHRSGPTGVERLRFPAFSSNDQITLALAQGDIDWAGAFVPAVERSFIGRDPDNHHAWFPIVGDTVFLYPNTTVAPLDQPSVRKAISLAIDREKVVQVAMYDYTVPAHPTGLSDGYAEWRIDPVPEASSWVRHDPARAEQMLDDAGFPRGADGLRQNPDGTPLTIELTIPAGWSDWVRAARVIARDLRAIGIDVRVQGRDFTAWFDAVARGEFSLSLGWAASGPTPYRMYRTLMDPDGVEPIGQPAAGNWGRHASPRARALLDAFERTTDRAEHLRLAHALQAVFLEEAPALPLFPSASWGEANTRWVTGFPSEANPYARLSPNAFPEPLLVLTHLQWRDTEAAP